MDTLANSHALLIASSFAALVMSTLSLDNQQD
jgi:hypothetical protein